MNYPLLILFLSTSWMAIVRSRGGQQRASPDDDSGSLSVTSMPSQLQNQEFSESPSNGSGSAIFGGSKDFSNETQDRSLTARLFVTASSETDRKANREGLQDNDDPEGRLLKRLFENYDKRKRPVRDFRTPVKITFTMTLYQLLEVTIFAKNASMIVIEQDFWRFCMPDVLKKLLLAMMFQNEPQEYLMLNVWMAQVWHDEILTWNPAEFNNITYMVLPWEDIWLSDIVLYNGLEMNWEETEKRINVELTMDPNDLTRVMARFAFPAMYKFSCKMDVYYFPYDIQNCTMVFGSWVYDVRHVDVAPASEDVFMSDFLKNQAWDVVSFHAYRHAYNYSCCPYAFASVHYHFIMHRKPLFFLTNLVIPTVIIAWVSFLGFFMPGTSGADRMEKVNLGINTCLAMSILLLMVADRMPTSSTRIPIMALYFVAIIIIITFAILCSTFVIMIHRQWRYGRRIPPKIRWFFFCVVARLVFVFIPECVKNSTATKCKSVPSVWWFTDASDVITEDAKSIPRQTNGKAKYCRLASSENSGIAGSRISYRTGDNVLTTSVLSAASDLKQLPPEVINEWEVLADIIERVLLYVFTAVLLIVTGAMANSIFFR